ncbi:homoserine dehydrogenase [Limisalsivibrio acetivorans]|uniref:homoserine dehydrogenase n=1 Tax=Limisalsivibrio acetivorans TaxID=1304888 RepID=UPI0003B750BD|nr:homoserine dehydrogenase [Limisalsivibrio acetivorans]
MAKQVNVGIIGYGTVGQGTLKNLFSNTNSIAVKTGLDITVKTVADLKIEEFTSDELLEKVPVKTTNGMDVINDPEIDIVVELIGGYNVAREFILAAINNRKHVVTANKALLAVHGAELFKAAQDNGVNIGFEAAVAGGIPIIRVLKEDLAANRILEISGIINGTANYILTRMETEGKEFHEVLADAQELGYAEADPTFDVEGQDTAHKIALLASIGFATLVPFEKIYVEGITSIKQVDIQFAKKLGCKIKLLAIAKRHDDDIEVRVHPTIIPETELLAQVGDVFNAVQVKGNMVGDTMHYGRGAGGEPTGSAVAGDIISIARDVAAGGDKRVPVLGFTKEYTYYFPLRDIKEIESSFYLRFSAVDQPGSMAEIAGILSKYGISISQAIQSTPQNTGEVVPLVFMTHLTEGSKVMNAVEEINNLGVVRDKTVVIRVEGLD